MDEIIHQLTHDNKLFQDQWNSINTHLEKTSLSVGAKAVLDALADYVLDEPQDILPYSVKFVFVKNIIKRLVKENLSISIDDVVQVFTRVLDGYVTGCWHLNFIELIYTEFNLAKSLCSIPIQIHLIKQIFTSLQKKSFVNEIKDDDKKWEWFLANNIFNKNSSASFITLNNKEVMEVMRTAYQQLYRCAIKYVGISSVWSAIEVSLKSHLSDLFDTYDSLTDAEQDLSLYPDYPNYHYLCLLISSFEKNSDLFKANYIKILETVEHLILIGKFMEASTFIDRVIRKHLTLIDITPFLHMLIRICSLLMNSTEIEPRNLFCSKILYNITYPLRDIKVNKNIAPLFFDLFLAVLKLLVMDAPQCVQNMIVKSDFFPWKDLGSRITDLVRICISYDSIVHKSYFSNLGNLEKILQLISERAKQNSVILRATHEVALEAILRWSNKNEKYSLHVYKMGEPMLNLVDQHQITADICSKFIDALYHRIYADSDDEEFTYVNNSLFRPMSARLSTFLGQLKTVPHDIHKQLSSFFVAALDRPLHAENGIRTFECSAIWNLWLNIGSILIKENDVRLYLICLDRMYTLQHDEDDKDVRYWWVNFWLIVGMKLPQIAADRLEQLLIIIIDRKDMTCLSLLPALYKQRQEPFHARLDDLVNELFVDNAQHLPSLGYILCMIIKEHPELITMTHLKYIFAGIDDISVQNTRILFQSLIPVANYQPHLFDTYHAQLLRRITEQQDTLAYLCFQQYLIASAIVGGEKIATQNLNTLIDILKNSNTPNDIQSYIFYGFQLIGVKYKHVLEARRNDLVAFQSNTFCRSVLDYIDGHKMTEENQAAIKRAEDEMGQMEKRVIKTEQDVQQVTESIKEQEINTTIIRTRVDMVDTRLIDVTEQIEKHEREIERIDAKTLSYVPEWGREVSKLLNHRANNDWRLLGKRFGYSSSELKHWAMQTDPSMALLNEWYMTHKTDEATYGLIKMLVEIDRHDVENIIRQAITATGEIIPDDLPDDIKRLPPIFLSYQWGSQTAVTTLKYHLEEAGYACWMDTGQMGGGDKLFAKIDAGIRGAKVIICCMTTAYAQSDNCLREVHLTVSTGKPLIPLQMEKQSWPPEGALGPIMSEYLFIRFFDRKNTNATNYWPEERFAELLGQIRYHVAPDPDMITEQYHNWFVPKIDNLIFIQPSKDNKENKTKTKTKDESTSLKDTPLVVTHPQVMISYQWDRQGDIVALYKRLTQLGYRVWLDIFQMGGGDSLFEKIDSGIRHSLCVIACITPKYTMSINCRREMALADALTKPIIPLLLEKTSTWPPAGPMALVFADKVYIDFRNKNVTNDNDDLWSNKEFQQILARLKQFVPEVQTEKSRRHLLDMQRPVSAARDDDKVKQRPKRLPSAPIIPESRACSIM